MQVILSGYEGSKKILPVSSYLLKKYLIGHNITFLNYGEYTGKLYCGSFVSLKEKQDSVNDWSKDISTYLESLDDEFIIFALDDFLLAEPIHAEELDKLSVFGEKVNLHTLADPNDNGYSVTTQYTIWKRELLLDILSKFKTPWEFEIEGSKYFNSLGKKSEYVKLLHYDDGSGLSTRHPEKVNVNLLKRNDVEDLIILGHLNRENLILGQSNGPVPNYE